MVYSSLLLEIFIKIDCVISIFLYNNSKRDFMFKENVIENKRKKDLEKKQRKDALLVRNKFLAEWASNILELDAHKKIKYINKFSKFTKENNKFIIKKIEEDFAKYDILISYKEILLKTKDFHIKANILVENKFKLNNWK